MWPVVWGGVGNGRVVASAAVANPGPCPPPPPPPPRSSPPRPRGRSSQRNATGAVPRLRSGLPPSRRGRRQLVAQASRGFQTHLSPRIHRPDPPRPTHSRPTRVARRLQAAFPQARLFSWLHAMRTTTATALQHQSKTFESVIRRKRGRKGKGVVGSRSPTSLTKRVQGK